MTDWQDIQESIRNCRMCQSVAGRVFTPFKGDWPTLPEPRRKAILFISEAPPPDGGFWTFNRRMRNRMTCGRNFFHFSSCRFPVQSVSSGHSAIRATICFNPFLVRSKATNVTS